MPLSPARRSSWIAFLVGFLLLILPLAVYVTVRHIRAPAPKPESTAPLAASPAPRVPEIALDETDLREAGPSLPDSTPPPSPLAVGRALDRTEGWLWGFTIDPYGGTGTDSLRLFALEVECWHRIAAAEDVPQHQRLLEAEVRTRLQRFLDPPRLAGWLRAQRSAQGMLEVLMLAVRCRDQGMDLAPVRPALQALANAVGPEMDQLPPSTAALYAAHLAALDMHAGRPLNEYRAAGIISSRPREIRMGLRDVRALTQEIVALTLGSRDAARDLTQEEKMYLRRVLPFFAMTYTVLQNQELAGDLLSCLNVMGMTDAYGYREGMRVLVTRQNPDGSFGDASGEGTVRRAGLLAPTASCVTALSLERMRAR